MKRTRQSSSPSVFLLESFASDSEIERLIAISCDEALLASAMVSTERDRDGSSIELPVALDPLLEAIARRMREAAALPDASLTHLRLRHTREGQGHPAHFDDYEIDGERLVASVLVTLSRPERGGRTRFLRAQEAPLAIAPQAGDALLWYDVCADGVVDTTSWHDGEPVQAGEKITLAGFLYAPVEAIEDHPLVREAPARRERLYTIVDRTPAELRAQLESACISRGVEYVEIHARDFDQVDVVPLEPGAMLYRAATSEIGCVVEQLLAQPGVATFYTHPLGAHILHDNQSLVLARCGVPTPRAIFALTDERATLRRIVSHLGGFPVVLKVPGRSLGVGVMKLSDWDALFSVVDLVYATHGTSATLMTCVEPATHWRVIVVGDEAASTYINPAREDDFRTEVDEGCEEDFLAPPPRAVTEAALDACAVLGLEMGGVDVLEHPSGRVYVLEVNFPCYFAHPFEAIGEDVAGIMVEHLRAKASSARQHLTSPRSS